MDPSDDAAVVGGNVLTSQRVVDVVLKAFRVCAASQGCMNNVTFGSDTWGCYETVAGGSGAVSNKKIEIWLVAFIVFLINDFDNIQCTKTILCALVRSILEYCCIVWMSYSK